MPGHHGEALLHRGVDVRCHAAARVHPGLHVEHLSAIVVDGPPEGESLPENRILHQLLSHLISFQRIS
jgi:hypothetical protein